MPSVARVPQAPRNAATAAPLLRARPAPFWHRYAAWSLDLALCSVPVMLLAWLLLRSTIADAGREYQALLLLAAQHMVAALQSGASPAAIAPQWLADPQLAAASAQLQHTIDVITWPTVLAIVVISGAYHAVFESRHDGATPGQRALGLRVTDVDGARITAMRALARHAAGALSWITLNIGQALVLVPPAHLALHDRVSATRVVQDLTGRSARLPAWAIAWIAAQTLLLLWATVAFAVSSRGALEAGLGLDQTVMMLPLDASGAAQTSRHMKYITPNSST